MNAASPRNGNSQLSGRRAVTTNLQARVRITFARPSADHRALTRLTDLPSLWPEQRSRPGLTPQRTWPAQFELSPKAENPSFQEKLPKGPESAWFDGEDWWRAAHPASVSAKPRNRARPGNRSALLVQGDRLHISTIACGIPHGETNPFLSPSIERYTEFPGSEWRCLCQVYDPAINLDAVAPDKFGELQRKSVFDFSGISSGLSAPSTDQL